jgi:DNA-binding winged helix-turn-helix (wHTH) protein/TolB-like protein
MYEPKPDTTWMHGIDLAQEPDFDLGFIRVRPAKCEVKSHGATQSLQRRVMQVLVVLAQARGSVISHKDLVNWCWRGLSVSDDAIFRCISRLRKLASGYADPPFAIETIPGVGYRLTSAGFAENDRAAEPAAPHDVRFRFRALFAAAGLAALVIMGTALWTFLGRAPDHFPIRVAVQSFDTLSNTENARSLARRIPNEVVNQFGDSQIMTVLAGEQAAKEASPALGLVVTGLLREEAPNFLVDVRVEDGATGAALWSMEFKRNRREASDLPLEVAARVADVVNIAIFARSADPPLTDDAALSALLQTNDMIRDSPEGAWAQMLERANRVVARHPEFAFGHSVLASAYARAARNITGPDRAQAVREAARREANLTLKLDRQDAGAYAVLSELEPAYNYRASEAILLRGTKFAKHPKAPLGALYSYEGRLLGDVGRLREALTFQLVAHAIDEWGPPKTAQLARAYANMGNLPAARGWLKRAVQLWPNHSGVRRVRQYIAGFYEQPSDALANFDAMDTLASADANESAVWRSFIKARAADSERSTAETAVKVRHAADQDIISPEIEIMMLAGLGETKQAFEAANSALEHQELQAWFLFTPVTRNLRQDPGFVGLASRMGLIKYWRETGKRPDICTDRATLSECSPQLLAALKSN